MNYIVISPYYPHNFQKFSIELKNQGFNVLGIGEEPYDQLDDRLKDALTEYFRVNSLDDVEEVKRAVAFLFHKHGPIDRIESQNEHWMELDAALRTQFNVYGLKERDLKKTKHKSEMKKYFEKAGVPVVPGFLVKKEKDIDKGVKKLKLPLIAKPDNGVGAAATFKLQDKNDVENFKKEWDGKTAYFLEPFVSASDIVTFDGMWSSSLTDSTSKGKPDIEAVDTTARLTTINEIFEVTTKPLIYDADTGGKPEHFEFTVKTLERVGVSAVIIEDKTGLKKNSLFGTEVEQTQDTIENFCYKIRSGKKVQITDDFMIIARIESLILDKGMEDALKRAFAYIDAGADGIMIHSRKKDPTEIINFVKGFREKDKNMKKNS